MSNNGSMSDAKYELGKHPDDQSIIAKILIALGLRKPKGEIIRRDPLTEVSDVLRSEEAMEMIVFALKSSPPTTVLRWDKLLKYVNRRIEPSEDEPDPIRLDLTEESLDELLNRLYQSTTSGSAESLQLMRQFVPNFYDKHTYERAKKVSHFERNNRALTNECYSYGELEYEVFATIYAKVVRAYGVAPEGFFVDLGAGVGQLVFTAALVGEFKRVMGIEHIDALMERGSKRMVKWDMANARLPDIKRQIEFSWVGEDFTQKPATWYDATFIMLHWTTFNADLVKLISNLMNQCKEGCIVVSFVRPLLNEKFKLLVKDVCKTSYGKVDFFVQEKTSPPSERQAIDYLNDM